MTTGRASTARASTATAGRGRTALAAIVALVAVEGCLPAPATAEARSVDDLYRIFMAIAALVAVIVIGLTVFAILRYRRRAGDDELPRQAHGDLRFEAVWTAIPIATIVLLLLLTIGVLGSFDRAVQATDGVDLQVTAFRWGWRFAYPADSITVEGVGEPGPEVMVPVGQTVRITLTGEDVIHAFYVPQFLFKKDAVPGRQNQFAFTVDEPGTYRGQCAEFCGIYHSRMPFTIVAVAPDAFAAWVAVNRGTSTSVGGSPLPSTP